ncbi:MoaF-related domain-containing protein [Paraburkholderia tropica]|uniref:MoaF-related domain-containing protein n=1 Tax=Paraburkholderia tropica TaxID=92647 RepID=UPI0031E14ADD
MNQATLFPYAGRSFIVKYSEELVFRNTYSPDGKIVTAEFLAGEIAGTKMSMPFAWQALEGGNFLLSWQEVNKSTVVHCDNFEAKTTRSFYTMMNGSFFVMEGVISE